MPAMGSIHPIEGVGQHEADDDEHRHRCVGDDVDHGCAHVVVAVHRRGAVVVSVLLENDRMGFGRDPDAGREGVRLGDLLHRLETIERGNHREGLARTIGPRRLHGDGKAGIECALDGPEPEARGHTVLEDLQLHGSGRNRHKMAFVVTVRIVRAAAAAVTMPVAMIDAAQ